MMQDAIGHAQLADVVQARAQFQAAYRHAIQPVCPAQFPASAAARPLCMAVLGSRARSAATRARQARVSASERGNDSVA